MKKTSSDTLYQILRDKAEDIPEAVAIVSPEHEPVTYRQLLEHVDFIIDRFSEIGVARTDRIAIVLPNSFEFVATFLGISCVAISAPINPLYKESEIDFYLSDLPAKALVVEPGVDSAAVSAAKTRGIPLIAASTAQIDGAGGFAAKASASSRCARRLTKPDDVALVLYTSGTTAKPKRVPLTHRNLCASASSISRSLQLGGGDRCLNVMPLFHIHGLIGALVSSLAAGASIALTPNFDGARFFDWMAELKPTWYTGVPAVHQAILRHAREHPEALETCRLRLIRSSSAPLSRKMMAELEEVFQVPVIEAYGMTEAAHQITSNPLPPLPRKPGSVGVPTHTEIAIVDGAGNFLTQGGRGEIVLRGVSVIRGYELQGEAHRDSFTNDWFCTGDLGYFDSDGYLFVTGRLKEIINRGGDKISPREIEEVLLEYPNILQAAAFAMPHPSLGETVAAAVVVRDRAQTTAAMIQKYLVGRLADFKLPTHLLFIDDIPKTSTGKVRRADLARLFGERLKSGFVAPKNQLEALIAGIYAEVLDRQEVGAGDNFFALGGDSVRATQVASRVRALFSIDLPIAIMFAKPTVAEIVEEITASMESHRSNFESRNFSRIEKTFTKRFRPIRDDPGSPK